MNRARFIGVTLLVLLLNVTNLAAETPNPFFSGTKATTKTHADTKAKSETESNTVKKSEFGKPFYAKLVQFQRIFNNKITAIISDYKAQKNLNLLFYVWLIAMGYGFFHAMMPGHGKNIILGWILTSPKRFRKVVITASLAMMMHVFTAVIMVYTIWLLIGGRISTQSSEISKYFSFFAFAILLYVAISQLVAVYKSRKGAGHHHDHQLTAIDSETSWRECVITASTIGLIPCPVSTILIVFMISQGLHLEGLLTGLFFATGMAGTLLTFSTLVWTMRSIIIRKKNHLLTRFIEFTLPVAGSFLMIAAGLVLITPYL